MSSLRTYILDTRVVSLLHNDTVCIQCGCDLNIGDEVTTKRGGSGKRRMYCTECAVILGLIDQKEGDQEDDS